MSTNLLQTTENTPHPEESASFTRVYYLFEVEPDSPSELILRRLCEAEFNNPAIASGIDSWTATEGQSVAEALAEFTLTLGVLEEWAMWIAVMSMKVRA